MQIDDDIVLIKGWCVNTPIWHLIQPFVENLLLEFEMFHNLKSLGIFSVKTLQVNVEVLTEFDTWHVPFRPAGRSANER